MKKLGYGLFGIAILLSGVAGALAQGTSEGTVTPGAVPTPTETNAPAAIQSPQKFYLELDAADLDALSKAIVELPKRVADPLLLKLNGQLRVQSQIVENKEAAEKPKKGRK